MHPFLYSGPRSRLAPVRRSAQANRSTWQRQTAQLNILSWAGCLRMLPPILTAVCLTLCGAIRSAAADELMDAGRAVSIDLLLDSAIRRNMIDGGVVVIGNRSGVLFRTARGGYTSAEGFTTVNERTLFDIASLTKVVATAPAIMKLLENGRISLVDPITRWFPELEGSGREEVTLLNLLTHTSGFDDISLPADSPLVSAIQKTATYPAWKQPGDRFRYADINFILLGELVQRATGKPFDLFCREQIHAPLGMADTQFLPQHSAEQIAPTIGATGEAQTGIVQDENARRMGGIAGHAGLFSSASDLSRFATMILNSGTSRQEQIFNERTVSQMTAPYFSANGTIIRGLGWDISSPFSSPRGSSFSDMSFGHTGYSGSSIWIDPERDLYVIVLTIRRDYRDIRQFSRLRSGISTIAASVFSRPRDIDQLVELTITPGENRLIP